MAARLPEDASERRQYENDLRLYRDDDGDATDVDRIKTISHALRILHSVAPGNGSYKAMLAIYSNDLNDICERMRS